jgi:hypothetical protein
MIVHGNKTVATDKVSYSRKKSNQVDSVMNCFFRI